MRQVNGWGFKRIVSGNDHNSYYHELFLRDYPQLCLKMKRIRKGDKLSEAMEEKEEKSNEEHCSRNNKAIFQMHCRARTEQSFRANWNQG